jgi:hypothetical protein
VESSFLAVIEGRCLEQFGYVTSQLQSKASNLLPAQHAEPGELAGINGSSIQAVLSIHWDDYRSGLKKAEPKSTVGLT